MQKAMAGQGCLKGKWRSCINFRQCGFRRRDFIKDKREYSIMIQWSVLQEGTTSLLLYVPNHRIQKYGKEKLITLKEEIHKHRCLMILTPSVRNRSSRQKPRTHTQTLSSTISGLLPADFHRMIYPTAAEYTFSDARGSLTVINHIWCHKHT